MVNRVETPHRMLVLSAITLLPRTTMQHERSALTNRLREKLPRDIFPEVKQQLERFYAPYIEEQARSAHTISQGGARVSGCRAQNMFLKKCLQAKQQQNPAVN
jgi:hypothetical protein